MYNMRCIPSAIQTIAEHIMDQVQYDRILRFLSTRNVPEGLTWNQMQNEGKNFSVEKGQLVYKKTRFGKV